MNKGKIDYRLDLAKQMILRNQTVQANNLQRGLLWQRFLEHVPSESKVPAKGEDFVISLRPAEWRASGC